MTVSNQVFFNKAANHLLRQNEVCVNDRPGRAYCAYWRPDGLRCALGGALPLAVAKKLKNRNIDALKLYSKPLAFATRYMPYNQDLAVSLQSLHDEYAPAEWAEWAERLKKIAKEYGLTY